MRPQLAIAALFCLSLPGSLSAEKKVHLRSTSPVCPLVCPKGFTPVVYSWQTHPNRTNYDEQGHEQVAPDSGWRVSCTLRCEQATAEGDKKIWSDNKVLCDSGAEPGPFRGPWRITGQFTRDCDARVNNGCGMQCYEMPKPAAPTKGKKAGRK